MEKIAIKTLTRGGKSLMILGAIKEYGERILVKLSTQRRLNAEQM